MGRMVTALVIALLLCPFVVQASVICIPATEEEVVGDGLQTRHNNIHMGSIVYAGTIIGFVDCVTPTPLYCVGVNVGFCLNSTYNQAPDLTSHELVWILNNYYPAVPGMPAELATADERAAAVQLAIWHFSDGVDISSDGQPLAVFDAARAIIVAAMTASVPATPTTLVITPADGEACPGYPLSVTAKLLDQNGQPMPGVVVNWTISTVVPPEGSGTTDGDGEVTASWTGVGSDVVTFSVDYTIPIGLRWMSSGCQDIVSGGTAPGHVGASWIGSECTVPVSPTTWGNIKGMYR